jgi:hypothetical protein
VLNFIKHNPFFKKVESLKFKEGQMGRACRAKRNAYKILVGKPEG